MVLHSHQEMSVPGDGLCIVKYKVASFVCSILCYLCCNGSCVCAQKHDFLNLSKNHEISKQNKRVYNFGRLWSLWEVAVGVRDVVKV